MIPTEHVPDHGPQVTSATLPQQYVDVRVEHEVQQNQNVRQAEEPVEPGLHLGTQLLGQDDADLRRVEDERDDIRTNYFS